ncbi:uncharacterized protein LOC125590664 [Brassica napus]|uniref:uncharacterized protein LOC125590664 n=1 Tax=Brassica napus TaxID=3708 RepID=UPI00207B0845|nr:uncharacterized protein LOC125590664 [Brassica napus]
MAPPSSSQNLPSNPADPSPITDHYENSYYLNSSDHAGLKLVTDRLTFGADFHSWRRSVQMALNVRNKLGFVDGTIRKPSSTSRDSGSWSRCNDMVSTWLINSVSKNIGQSLLFMSTAESIWNNLLSRFKQDDAPRVFEIELRLSVLSQGSLDVSAYYTELITLWEEYKNYIELHVCTCGHCECNAALLWEQLQQRGRVTKFLMGFNDTMRGSVISKPVVKTDVVAFQTTGPGPAAEYVKFMELTAAYNAYRPHVNRPLCTHCGQLGHTVAKCFKLHGYPPGYKSSSSGYQGQSYGAPQRPFTPCGQQNYTPRSQIPPKTVAQITSHADSTQYVPPPAVLATSLDVNQLSSSQLQSIIQQLQSRVQLPENDFSQASMIGKGDVFNSLYILDLSASSSTALPAGFCGSLSVNSSTWHNRLGHLSAAKLHVLSDALSLPSSCMSSHEHYSSTAPSALLHLDTWGPFSTESVDSHKYFLTIVDDATRVTWVYMLSNKTDVSHIFPTFITHVQTQYNAKLKAIRTDNAQELRFTDLITKYGLTHYFSCAYTSQQNSVVERKHQHLLNVAKALLFQSNIPLSYWSDCVVTAAFLINRLPSPLLNNKSPYELLLKKIPDYNVLRAFGCLCYVSTHAKDRHKFSPRARASVFLGYPFGYKGYKVLNLDTRSVSISRNVVFHETIFPLRDDSSHVFGFFSHIILPASASYVPESTPTTSHASSSHNFPTFPPSHVVPMVYETVISDTSLVSCPV